MAKTGSLPRICLLSAGITAYVDRFNFPLGMHLKLGGPHCVCASLMFLNGNACTAFFILNFDGVVIKSYKCMFLILF